VNARRAGVLAPLRHRDFRSVVLGWLASLLGDGVFRVSIAFQVYLVDPDPRSFALVGLVWALSQVVLLPLGGWAGDRFPRRHLVLLADLWRALAIGALGVLSVTDRLTIPALVVIAACFGAGNAAFNPAATALLPELVPEDELDRANALLGGARPTMLYIAGPLLGAVVVGLTETGVAFLFDAVTFLVSAALVARVPARSPKSAGAVGLVAQLREAGDGVAVVLATRWLLVGMLATTVSGLAFQGPFESLVPFRLITDFDYMDSQAGFALAPILAASGVGAVATAWWIGRHDLPRRLAIAYYWGEAAALLALVPLGLMTSPRLGVLAGVVIGAMFALTEVVWTTSVQRGVPRERLGRVASLDWMVGIGLAPVSFLLAGQLGARFGAGTVLVAAGVLGAVALVALSFVPGARGFDGLARIRAATAEPAPADPTGTPREPSRG